MMGFGGIFGILLIGVVVWAVIQLVNKDKSGNLFSNNHGKVAAGGDALDILKQRYARGEISREEYERMKQDLK